MKIYTKKGDKGITSLLGGEKVSKHHIRIEAYGTLDELNSYIGVLRSYELPKEIATYCIKIQNILFTIGSHLAATKETLSLPALYVEEIDEMEKKIDEMELELPALTSFILPGGNRVVSFCHVARCVCRRAERLCVVVAEHEKIHPVILPYLNRLSDYLFVLSRYLSQHFNVQEVLWKSK